MQSNRRDFLGVGLFATLFGGAACLFPAASQQQQHPRVPERQQAPEAKDEESSTFPSSKKSLEQNEKDIKKSVERLFQLASDLKSEVEKTDSVNVLSLAMLRKADEIERLAHDIKNRAKG